MFSLGKRLRPSNFLARCSACRLRSAAFGRDDDAAFEVDAESGSVRFPAKKRRSWKRCKSWGSRRQEVSLKRTLHGCVPRRANSLKPSFLPRIELSRSNGLSDRKLETAARRPSQALIGGPRKEFQERERERKAQVKTKVRAYTIKQEQFSDHPEVDDSTVLCS